MLYKITFTALSWEIGKILFSKSGKFKEEENRSEEYIGAKEESAL